MLSVRQKAVQILYKRIPGYRFANRGMTSVEIFPSSRFSKKRFNRFTFRMVSHESFNLRSQLIA
jgi:hypothetical protein